MSKELRAKRAEKFWSGGRLIVHGGGTQIFLDGGKGFDGGGQPLHAAWPPHSPPC